MSRSYWRTIVAVVGWLITCPTLAEQAKQEQTQSQGETDTKQSKALEPSVPVRILEEPEKSEADKRREQEREYREKEDLAAQQAMARGTEDIVWLSKLQLSLAFLGTLAIVYSLLLNRRATNAAIAANESTKMLLEHERESASVELAASLHVEPRKFIFERNPIRVKVLVQIHNTGSSVAHRIIWRDSMVLVMNNHTRIDGFKYRGFRPIGPKIGVIPSRSHRDRTLHFRENEIDINGSKAALVREAFVFGRLVWISHNHKVCSVEFELKGSNFKRAGKGFETTEIAVSYDDKNSPYR